MADLASRALGYVILGISATQAVLQFGDMGQAVLLIEKRSGRAVSYSGVFWQTIFLVLLVLGGGALCIAVGWLSLAPGAALGAGLLAGAAASADRLRSIESSVRGDLVRSYLLISSWTNSPKIGLILGAAIFGGATWPLFLAVVTAVASLRVPPPLSGSGVRNLGRFRSYGPAAICLATGWALSWIDVYVVASASGLSAAAGYGLASRGAAAVSYVYNPFDAMVVARVNEHGILGCRRPLVFAITLAMTASSVFLSITWFLIRPEVQILQRLGSGTLIVLSMTPVVASISLVCGTTLKVLRRTPAVARSGVIAVGVEAAALAIFVPMLGTLGAALAAFTGMLVSASSQGIIVLKLRWRTGFANAA